MNRVLIIILALLFLSGCATMKDKFCDYEIILPPSVPIAIDPALFKSCQSLAEPGIPLTYEGILSNYKTNTAVYIDCRNKLDAAIVVLKKFSNQK